MKKIVKFNINPLFSGPSLDQRIKSGGPYREISLSDIDVDPDQPRRTFDPEGLAELAASIKEYGVLCPILVKVTDLGTYKLVAGERRFRASKLIGLDVIPAIIDNATDESSEVTLAKQLVENIQRADLPPMERAFAIGQLRDKNNLSVRDLAKQLGVSKSLVQRSLDILTLPDDLQAALLAGASESKVSILAKIKDRELRKELLLKIEDLSRTEVEKMVEELLLTDKTSIDSSLSRRGTVSQDPINPRLSLEDQRLVSEIQKSIGTKIQLQRSKANVKRGKLVIEFYSDEELGELHHKLTYK